MKPSGLAPTNRGPFWKKRASGVTLCTLCTSRFWPPFHRCSQSILLPSDGPVWSWRCWEAATHSFASSNVPAIISRNTPPSGSSAGSLLPRSCRTAMRNEHGNVKRFGVNNLILGREVEPLYRLENCGIFIKVSRMKFEAKTTPVRCFVPPAVMKDFAGVRGLVKNAVEATPRSVTLSSALMQARTFSNSSPKK
jgi:hypothetical protein